MAVFARHGFQNVVERAKLGRFILEKFTTPNDKRPEENLRESFEELGPTFVKLGQLLASRPDLVPPAYVQEFKRLHDQVPPIPFDLIRGVLENHYDLGLEQIFERIDEQPLAAASIAQVHKARLKSGREVVIKVQRPGITQTIEEDLGVLYRMAELLDRYIPEARPYNPVGIVEEFSRSLEQEINFIIESNNIRRFAENFADHPNIKIPRVYTELSGRQVLVLEKLDGIPLSQKEALQQEGVDPEEVLKVGLRAYLNMVFRHGLFHGDLHAGNMFVLPHNRIGLIDFGVVGRLNKRVQGAVANMLLALAEEDYDRLAYEYVDIAPYSGHVDVDQFARDLRDLIAPYYGLSLRYMNVGRLLMDSTRVASKYSLVLPSELILFFRSIVAIEGMGRVIARDFDFLSYSLQFAAELLKSRYEPTKLLKDATTVVRDVNSLLYPLPRQLKQLIRKLNNPRFAVKIDIDQITSLKRSVETSANLLFLGMVIGSLILGGSLSLNYDTETHLLGLPLISAVAYGVAAFLSTLAFYNYIKK